MIDEEIKTDEALFPVFRDEGKFTVIDGERVESGKYFADTRAVQQYVNLREWAAQLKLTLDNQIIDPDDDTSDIPNLYKPQGEIYRLWDVKNDPLGERAKVVHTKMVDLMKSNIPAEEIDEQIRDFIQTIDKKLRVLPE